MNNYYELNAKKYIEDTIDCDMKETYEMFLKYMPKKGNILDVGFGSGRDMIYFENKGYKVEGVDPTKSFCINMKNKGYEVYNLDSESMNFDNKYEGIWACASLLHSTDLKKSLSNCANALKDGGVMYVSFKYGTFKGERNGRYFTDLNEELFEEFIKDLPLIVEEYLITSDVRKDRSNEKWLNVVVRAKIK